MSFAPVSLHTSLYSFIPLSASSFYIYVSICHFIYIFTYISVFLFLLVFHLSFPAPLFIHSLVTLPFRFLIHLLYQFYFISCKWIKNESRTKGRKEGRRKWPNCMKENARRKKDTDKWEIGIRRGENRAEERKKEERRNRWKAKEKGERERAIMGHNEKYWLKGKRQERKR